MWGMFCIWESGSLILNFDQMWLVLWTYSAPERQSISITDCFLSMLGTRDWSVCCFQHSFQQHTRKRLPELFPLSGTSSWQRESSPKQNKEQMSHVNVLPYIMSAIGPSRAGVGTSDPKDKCPRLSIWPWDSDYQALGSTPQWILTCGRDNWPVSHVVSHYWYTVVDMWVVLPICQRWPLGWDQIQSAGPSTKKFLHSLKYGIHSH